MKIIGTFLVLMYINTVYAGNTIMFSDVYQAYQAINPTTKSLKHSISSKNLDAEYENSFSPLDFDIATENAGLSSLEFTVGQAFELGDQKNKRAIVMKNEVKSLKAKVEYEEREAELKIGSLYLAAIILLEEEGIIDSVIALTTDGLNWVEKSVAAGNLPKIDLLRMDLELKEVTFKKTLLQEKRRSIYSVLKVLTGIEIMMDDSLESPIHSILNLKPVSSIEEISPLQQISQADVETAKARVDAADTPLLKEIRLQGGTTLSPNEGTTVGLLNIGITVPLFSRTNSKVQSSKELLKSESETNKGVNLEIKQIKKTLVQRISLLLKEVQYIDTVLLPQSYAITKEMNKYIEESVFSFIDFQSVRKGHLALINKRTDLVHKLGTAWLELSIYTKEKINVFK